MATFASFSFPFPSSDLSVFDFVIEVTFSEAETVEVFGPVGDLSVGLNFYGAGVGSGSRFGSDIIWGSPRVVLLTTYT